MRGLEEEKLGGPGSIVEVDEAFLGKNQHMDMEILHKFLKSEF